MQCINEGHLTVKLPLLKMNSLLVQLDPRLVTVESLGFSKQSDPSLHDHISRKGAGGRAGFKAS